MFLIRRLYRRTTPGASNKEELLLMSVYDSPCNVQTTMKSQQNYGRTCGFEVLHFKETEYACIDIFVYLVTKKHINDCTTSVFNVNKYKLLIICI